MEIDDVMRRVRKCLALAKSDNASEAAAAMRQAQKLMEMYNITEEGLHQSQVGEERRKGTACVRPPEWEANLASMVGEAFHCHVLWGEGAFDRRRNRDIAKGQWAFIGIKHEALIASYSFEVLLRQLLKARARFLEDWKDENRHHTLKEKLAASTDFSDGFVSMVSRQVANIAPQDPALKAAVDSRALALTGDPLKTGQRDSEGGDGFWRGREAGEEARLHRPMEGTEQLKLGGR